MHICSTITGTVSEIVATVGSRIETDAEIMIIESMKMEIPITCPSAGVVLDIAVEVGTLVNEGDILAEVA